MDCMQNPILQVIKAKYTSLEPVLDERARRLWAGAEARAIGRGGITRVAQAIGLSRVTVRAGLKELDLPITPGLTHHNSESGLYGKFRVPSKPRLLPYSLATFR